MTALLGWHGVISSCSTGQCDAACDSYSQLAITDAVGNPVTGFAGTIAASGTTVEIACPGSATPSAFDVEGRQVRIDCDASAIRFSVFPPQSDPWSLSLRVDLTSSSQGSASRPVTLSLNAREEICERSCYVGNEAFVLR